MRPLRPRGRPNTVKPALPLCLLGLGLAVGLAVAGRMNPLIAAILMPVNSLATLLIVTGGMRRAFRADLLADKK